MSTRFILFLLSLMLSGCATKYIQGKNALSSCSFAPVDTWLNPQPISILCVQEVSMATEPEVVFIHVPNVSALFKTGQKIKKVSENDYIGTCSLTDLQSAETKQSLLNLLKENHMKTPSADYTYEIWTGVKILDGWLPQNYVEVIRSGSEAWIRTSLCSPS